MEDPNVQHFIPLLEKFSKNVNSQFRGQCSYTHALMLPHLISPEHYYKANKRIFYLGQDTRYFRWSA